ncbi:MAG: M3 family oligoendopeptidase [Geminicoccaceae bacterium]
MTHVRSAAAQAAEVTGEAPEWDLSDLYSGRDAPAIQGDLDLCADEAVALERTYQGHVADLSGEQLVELIRRYEVLSERLGRVGSYAQLLHATHLEDPEVSRFYQTINERANDIYTRLLFVTLEINRIEEDSLHAKIAGSTALAGYQPWLRDVRVFRPHQLSDEVERVLHEKHVTGRAAWVRLFDETMAALRFKLDGKDLTAAEIFNILSDTNRAKRAAAYDSIAGVLADNARLFALVTNTLAKDKAIEDGWRHYDRPISFRNKANAVEDEVVQALVDAVRDAYPRLSHRYYTLKARWMGLDKLAPYDRNAPLPDDDDRQIVWDEAKVVVLDAYRGFSPKLADLVDDFFARAWIDAQVKAGKDSGAFCHPTVTSVHPYVLMNFQGKARDVMTLAHELGHGVHQRLAAEQGPLMAGTPLTLAETASVFGEQLTFRALLNAESDPGRRRVLLAGKIEDAINTVVRQIAFCEFERRVHDRRKEGELTAVELGEIWMGVQRESLGPVFDYDDAYQHFWSYIPHFIHAPFYVYAYAFGDCLVNSLYARYQAEPDGFEAKYLEMLRAGGTLRHKELLAPFGLDASDPAFWSQGLGLIEGMIDELERDLEVA